MFERKNKQNQIIIGVLVFLALFAVYFVYSSKNQCPTQSQSSLLPKTKKPAIKKPALPPSSYNASKSMIQWHKNHCRRLRGKKFCDPYFIIIGAPKCGTTSLYSYFVDHPNIYPPVTKEVRYYNFFNYSRDYIEFFEVPSKINMRKDMITFEASTNYLLNSHTSKTISVYQRIAESIPDVKLIALLRNPVDRFMSHYNYRLIQVKLPPLQQKIDMDIKQLHNCYEKKKDKARCLLTNRGVNLDENLIVKSIYVEKFRQLYKWIPKEQVRAYISEQLFSNPAPILKDMHKFLDIPIVGSDFNKVLPQVETETRSSKNITKYSLNSQQRKFLCEFYRPFNEELVKLLGLKEYPWNC